MSKQNRPQYLVSTDSIGFFGKPEQFIKLWGEYFDDKTLAGVEAIAFKPITRLNNLISILNKNDIPVLSFHGKTGQENLLNIFIAIVMIAVNTYIFEAETLFKYFPEIEFLSHAPYLQNKIVKKTILKNNPKKIWIENSFYGKQGVENTIKQIIFYRKNKIDSSGMLDVYHYVANETKSLQTNWVKIVDELRSYILLKDNKGRQFFNGIHFPVGSRVDDSLPIDSMSDQMLELFAQKIIPHVERVVFENQQTFPGLLCSTDKMIEKQRLRNKRIIERLKKTGIIC